MAAAAHTSTVRRWHTLLRLTNTTKCVEVGCGSGYVITSLALLLAQGGHGHAHHITIDLTAAATAATSTTARQHGVGGVRVCVRVPHTPTGCCGRAAG